jgi:anti-sigma factor RsiW
VSILNRLKPDGHLDEGALTALWTDAALAGAEPAHPHLETCAACRGRLAAFSTWMDDLRDDALAEADEAFPPERLAAQRAQIARRLEASERPARVIAFPRFTRPIASSTSSVRRWVASAAAAGLIVGVAIGQFMDLSAPAPRTRPTAEAPLASARGAVPGVQPASLTLSDEELMSAIEDFETRRIPDSLTAYDTLTPRARDFPQ